ncbi:hypothetical protein ACWIUD_05390 [Helicobacter sp. 23-1044]
MSKGIRKSVIARIANAIRGNLDSVDFFVRFCVFIYFAESCTKIAESVLFFRHCENCKRNSWQSRFCVFLFISQNLARKSQNLTQKNRRICIYFPSLKEEIFSTSPSLAEGARGW